jgi:tetratricopeptide (TPR) repeat protein
MRRLIQFWAILALAALAGCGTTGSVSSIQQNADQAFAAGDYATSLSGYEQIIKQYTDEGKTNECPVYGKAGISALNTGNTNKAIGYLEMDTYTSFATAKTYAAQAEAYRKIDNLSKEMIALKNYLDLFPQGADADTIRLRLFTTYVESENWEFATALWPMLTENQKNNEEVLSMWFTVNKKTNNTQTCDILADQLLKMNPKQTQALEWKAIKAFDAAEDHYQTEMKAYEQNRTNKQYKRLLSELDKVTAEFQLALDYFDTLYQIDPSPRYAGYISNIYVRFDDEEKAEYYRKKAGK